MSYWSRKMDLSSAFVRFFICLSICGLKLVISRFQATTTKNVLEVTKSNEEEMYEKGTLEAGATKLISVLKPKKEVGVAWFGSGCQGLSNLGVTISMPLGRIFIHCLAFIPWFGRWDSICDPLFVDWFLTHFWLLLFTHPLLIYSLRYKVEGKIGDLKKNPFSTWFPASLEALSWKWSS